MRWVKVGTFCLKCHNINYDPAWLDTNYDEHYKGYYMKMKFAGVNVLEEGEEGGATSIIKEKINKEKITKNIFILISFIKSNSSIFEHGIEENLLSQMANSKDKICATLKNKFNCPDQNFSFSCLIKGIIFSIINLSKSY